MALSSISGDSPEAVALRLLEIIAQAEDKVVSGPTINADRAWTLSTYKECLDTVQGRSAPMKISPELVARARKEKPRR